MEVRGVAGPQYSWGQTLCYISVGMVVVCSLFSDAVGRFQSGYCTSYEKWVSGDHDSRFVYGTTEHVLIVILNKVYL